MGQYYTIIHYYSRKLLNYTLKHLLQSYFGHLNNITWTELSHKKNKNKKDAANISKIRLQKML